MIQADSDPVILDVVDKEIIELLRRDGRMSFAEISKRLDLPETTARYRVQRLLQTEAIQIIALRNQERLGMPYTTNITLVVENERVNSVVGKLTCMEEVRYLAITAGRYNVFVEVCFGEYADFLAFFTELQQVKGILRFETHMVVNLLKAEYKGISPESKVFKVSDFVS